MTAAPTTTALTLDADQSLTLKHVLDWQRTHPSQATTAHQVQQAAEFLIHGRAGTGKTTLIRHLAQALDNDTTEVLAPTNKAASNLRKKGIMAKTIHSLLYTPSTRGTKEQIDVARKRLALYRKHTADYDTAYRELRELLHVSFVLRQRDDEDIPEVAIVDECSMVPANVGEDLAALVPQLIAFGDPWQLPPVKARPYFRDKPSATLTTIHRQSRTSGILDMAERAYRTGQATRSYGDDARALYGNKIEPKRYLKRLDLVDQVLVGTNASRRAINHALRAYRQQTPIPTVGDTLVCVRAPDQDARELGLVNGFSYSVTASRIIDSEHGLVIDLQLNDQLDDTPIDYRLPLRQFLLASLPRDTQNVETYDDDYPGNPTLDFANALTVHKAQGSEYPWVLVQNESYIFRNEANRWLYTAITRAQEHVTVITGKPTLPPLPRSYLKDYLSLLQHG